LADGEASKFAYGRIGHQKNVKKNKTKKKEEKRGGGGRRVKSNSENGLFLSIPQAYIVVRTAQKTARTGTATTAETRESDLEPSIRKSRKDW